MTPATMINPQGKVVDPGTGQGRRPWNRVGVYDFDVDPYSDGATMFYNLRAEIERVMGGNLRYVLRSFM